MKSLLRKLSLVALPVFLSLTARGADVKGVLMDKMCSYKAETRIVPGPRLEGGIVVAYTHTRQCALMPECQKSGYGVFTYDQKFLSFDENGNRLALAALKATKKDDDLRVQVTGEIQEDKIKVTSIKWLE
ncbi:MAG: hypothetical protein JO062_10745 [Bryobacterales bacterium]|nr:hypothetical protein [Bryobacterales bacterium]